MITVARRYCGPPDSGNGGYTAGLFASEVSGRKTWTGTAAYDDDGRVVGRSEQVWIEVDPSVFNA